MVQERVCLVVEAKVEVDEVEIGEVEVEIGEVEVEVEIGVIEVKDGPGARVVSIVSGTMYFIVIRRNIYIF